MDIVRYMLPKYSRGILLFFFLFFFSLPSQVFAQLTDKDLSMGLESCFQYYQYGKVSVDLSSDKPSYTKDESIHISGSITNQNTFPLRDVVLLGHLRRINKDPSFSESGHHMVREMVLQSNIQFLPGERKHVSFDIPIESGYPQGEYILQYYAFSNKGFHYAGRPFLEEDIAGSSQFSIYGTQEPVIYFDIGKGIVVNGEKHEIREITTPYAEKTLSFHISLVDARKQKADLPVKISFYEFEDAMDDYLVESRDVVIPAGSSSMDVSFTPPWTGAFQMDVSLKSPQMSIFRYRFAKKGAQAKSLRVNDMGTTAFPPSRTDSAYLCFHSPAPELSPETSVLLQVLDSQKQVVDQKQVSGAFTGTIKAIHVPLSNLHDMRHFWVRSLLSWSTQEGPKQKELLTEYSCDVYKNSATTYTLAYDSSVRMLSAGGKNVCGDDIEQGGILDSLKVFRDNGVLSREWYSLSLPSRLSVADLSEGVYTAEMKSGNQKKITTFSISNTSSRYGIWSPAVLAAAWIGLVSLLGLIGVILLKGKKKTY